MTSHSYKGIEMECKLSTDIVADIARLAIVSSNEVVLIFDSNGIVATSVDAVNAMAFKMDIHPDIYEYDGDDDGTEICIEVGYLHNISTAKVKDGISVITLKNGVVRVDTHGLDIKVPIYSEYVVPPNDIFGYRDRLPNNILIMYSALNRFVSAAKGMAGNISMAVEDKEFIMYISEDDDDSEPDVKMTVPDISINDNCVGVISTYLTEYIFGVVGALSKSAKRIRIGLGRDHPCCIGAKLKNYEVLYVIAPRVIRDDDDE